MGEIVTVRLSDEELSMLDVRVKRDNVRTGKTGPDAATRSSIVRALIREAESRPTNGTTDVRESAFNASAVVAKLRGVRPAPAPIVEAPEQTIPGDFEEAPAVPEPVVPEEPETSIAPTPVRVHSTVRVFPPVESNNLDLSPDELEDMLRDANFK